jgi:hypothetical protein
MRLGSRRSHMGPLGMILSIIDTSRGRLLIARRRRQLIAAAILVAIALWLLIVHAR